MLILAIGSAVAIGAKRIGVAYNVALVLVGLVVALLGVLPRAPLDPELVLVGMLPVLVFQGALSANADHLRESKSAILALAIPGVALSLFGTAAVATWALELPFTTALVLGALLAITDTVSVLLAFRAVRVPMRLAAIMEGESLFNDGTALVLVATTAAVAVGGDAEPLAISRSLLFALGAPSPSASSSGSSARWSCARRRITSRPCSSAWWSASASRSRRRKRTPRR